MSKILTILVFAISLTGCAALKQDTGKYVEEAVVEKIKADIEAKLEAHGVTIAQVTSALADPTSGKVTKQSVATAAKETATEVAICEGKKLLDAEILKLASKNDLDSESTRLWKWLLGSLLGLVSTYLGKQALAFKSRAKKDKAFHDRILMLEKLSGLDLGVEDDDTPAPIPASTKPPEGPKGPQAPVV